MNDKIIILREAIVKVTQILAGKSINVTQRGVTAYVKTDTKGRPVEVNLPYLPDNATDELIQAIQGFLDHEVAKVLFTDFNVVNAVAEDKGLSSMLSMLEDIRIEREMANRFTGSAANMANTAAFFLKNVVDPEVKSAQLEGDAKKVMANLMVPMLRGMAGQHVFKDYMKDKMAEVLPVHDKIADLAAQIASTNSTDDCLELAKVIRDRLKGEDGGEGDDDGEQGEESESKGKGRGKAGKGKGKGKGEKKSAPKPAEGEESEEGESDGGEGEGEEENEEGEGAGEEPNDGGEDEGESAGGDDEGDGETDSEEGESDAGEELDTSNTKPVWELLDKDGANNFDKSVSRAISSSATEASKHAEYLIYSKDFDVIEPLKVGRDFKPYMLKELVDAVEHMVGPIQKDLERAISARSMATWEAGRRSGRLHNAGLARLAVGDTRVFRRRHEGVSKDVAVQLVIDASGSMSGQKINIATQSAYALANVLDRLKISNEVICFTTGEMPVDAGKMHEEERKLGRRYSRMEPLYMPILKTYNERLTTDVKNRFGWLPNSRILRNNIDGECVENAARRLLARREKGKIMIVLSDGHPAAYSAEGNLNKHLKETVKRVEGAGVNVIGIGIMDSAVRSFYKKNIVINNVSELPDRVIRELRHLLVG